MKRKIGAFLAVIFLMASLVGCNNGKQVRKITNEDKKQQSEVTDNKKDNKVNIDKSVYKGYKGPVQGEVKYKEGTPAGKNSTSHKASGDIESPYHIDLRVTRDFGHTNMYGKNVGLVKDEVGMEVLFRNLDIQTAYGGGFVNSINGLESGYTFKTGSNRKKTDWFYFINGILAPIGVGEYKPEPGDTIWWDYHDWNTTMFIPAVIGSYPQPFKSGFAGKNKGTVIMYTNALKSQAEKLKKALIAKGVKNIDVSEYDENYIEKPDKYCIVLGKWNDISKDSKFLKDTNWKNKMVGVYVEFKDGKMNSLDFKGKLVKSYDNAGAIYAISSGMGSTTPVWMITGINDENVKDSVEVLINKPESIKNYFGAVVTKEQVTNVPYLK